MRLRAKTLNGKAFYSDFIFLMNFFLYLHCTKNEEKKNHAGALSGTF